MSKSVIRDNWTDFFQLKNASYPTTADKIPVTAKERQRHPAGPERPKLAMPQLRRPRQPTDQGGKLRILILQCASRSQFKILVVEPGSHGGSQQSVASTFKQS
jgi:hypothetical protein